MAELQVIYDPNLELAAIVNVDERMGWGPAMIGPQAGNILQAFIDTCPFDVSEMDAYTAARTFASFLDNAGLAAPDTTPTPETGTVDTSADTGVDTANALAEAEATNAGDVPAEQPADTDTPQDTSTAPTVINCPNCNGSGSIQFGDGEAPQTCGMCGGRGKVTVGAPA